MSAQPAERTTPPRRPPLPRPWPGRWSPLGVTADDEGANVALWADEAERVELCLFDEDGRERRHRPRRADLPRLARLPARACGPASATASGSTARGTPRRAPLQPGQAARRPLRPGDRRAATYDDARLRATSGAARATRRDDRDSAPFVPAVGRRARRLRLGRRRTAGTRVGATPSIYEAHVRGLTTRHPRVPEHQRGHLRRASPTRRSSSTSPGSASPRSSCCRPPLHHRGAPARAGLLNYWGYNSLGYFAPHAAYSSTGSRGGQVSEFKAHGQDPARRRARGDPRRRLQPHRGGRRGRPDARLPRARQRRPTTSSRATGAATPTTPAAATPSTCRTPTCCSWSWTRCATGCRRCTSTASASTSPPPWPGRCTTSTCSAAS